jgi:hypothetical protein
LECLVSVLERLRGMLERLGAVLECLGGVLQRLGAVSEPYWSVLERLGGVLKRLGALLQAIWRDAEDVEKALVFLGFWTLGRSWRLLGGLLEASSSVLERVRVVLKRLVAILEAS